MQRTRAPEQLINQCAARENVYVLSFYLCPRICSHDGDVMTRCPALPEPTTICRYDGGRKASILVEDYVLSNILSECSAQRGWAWEGGQKCPSFCVCVRKFTRHHLEWILGSRSTCVSSHRTASIVQPLWRCELVYLAY